MTPSSLRPAKVRFLLDENVHSGLLSILSGWGHDAKRVPAGFKNGRVARMASDEERTLLTHDADFTDWEKFPPGRYPGIIWMNFRVRRLEALSEALSRLLNAIPPDKFHGRLFAVEEGGFREIA